MGKPDGKGPLGRPRRGGRIILPTMDRYELGWEGVDWIDLAEDWDRWRALVNAVMSLRIAENAGNFLTS